MEARKAHSHPLRTPPVAQQSPRYITSSYFLSDDQNSEQHYQGHGGKEADSPSSPPPSPNYYFVPDSTADGTPSAVQSRFISCTSTAGWLVMSESSDLTLPRERGRDITAQAKDISLPIVQQPSTSNSIAELSSLNSMSSFGTNHAIASMSSFNTTDRGEDVHNLISPPSFGSTVSGVSEHIMHPPDGSPPPVPYLALPSHQCLFRHNHSLSHDSSNLSGAEGMDARTDHDQLMVSSSSSSSPGAELALAQNPFRLAATHPENHGLAPGGNGHSPSGPYGPGHGGYRQAKGGYRQAQGSYGQAQGGYVQAQGGYGRVQGGYGQAQDNHGQAQGGCGRAQGMPSEPGVPHAGSGHYASPGTSPESRTGAHLQFRAGTHPESYSISPTMVSPFTQVAGTPLNEARQTDRERAPQPGVPYDWRVLGATSPVRASVAGMESLVLTEGPSGGPFSHTVPGFKFDEAPRTASSVVLPATPASGSLSSRPSLGLLEFPHAPVKKLHSQAMKVTNQWLWEAPLSCLLLTCLPGPKPSFVVLAARKKELLVYNLKQKTNAVQVLSSEVRAVTQHDNTYWVGMANGSVEVERAGVRVSIQVFECNISSIAVGPDGVAWVGSERGGLRVLELAKNGRSFLEHRNDDVVGDPSCVSPSARKITALCHVGHHMVLAQGEGDAAVLQLWENRAHIRERQDTFVCGQQYKTCNCICALPWRELRSTPTPRILTGHSKGAVLLWKGHEQGKLCPLVMIDMGVQHHSIRGMVPIPSVNALCVGMGKALHFAQLPTPKDLDGMPSNSVWFKGKTKQVPVHRSGLRLLAGTQGHLITSSGAGTVRLWEAEHIVNFLHDVGLQAVAPDSETQVLDSVMKQLHQNGQVIPSLELRMLRCIGSGAYGEVHQAIWKGIEVAVKKAHKHKPKSPSNQSGLGDWDSLSDQDDRRDMSGLPRAGGSMGTRREQLRELQREVQHLASVVHVNVVRLLGVVLDNGNSPMIVTEFYACGNVLDLIKRAASGKAQLSWLRRLQMLRDVAAGMLYLHTKEPHPVVHGDLRSPNLLLDASGSVKIADFGSSRIMQDTNKADISKACNPRWCAPEKLKSSEDSLPADVYSFAIVMWELLSLRLPFANIQNDFAVYTQVMAGGRPEIPCDLGQLNAPGGFVHLMQMCWAHSPRERPTFGVILDQLKDMLRERVVTKAVGGAGA